MATKHVIDTHALIWFLENNPRLGRVAAAVLADPASELVLPAIALAEACWITERGKSSIPNVQALLAALTADPRLVIAPLDYNVVSETTAITSVGEMHDRQIVATALLISRTGQSVALLTKDANICASGLVKIIW